MTKIKIIIEAFLSLIFFPLGIYCWFLNNKSGIKSVFLPSMLFISIVINVIAFNNILVKPSGMNVMNSLLWGNALTLLFLITRIVVRKLFGINLIIYYACCLFAFILLGYSTSKFAFYIYGELTLSISIFIISFVLYICLWLVITAQYPPSRRMLS